MRQKHSLLHNIKQVFKFICVISFCICTLNLEAQTDKAIPRNGEGLDAFLLRNGCNTTTDKEAFLALNKKKLGKGNTLLLGVKYSFPEKERFVTEPLLGEANKKVKIISHELDGAIFYLISGHGGPDPGAVGKYNGNDLYEDEYAYDIMLRLARQLLSMGATVHIIIQDSDDGIRDDAYLKNDTHETCVGKTIPLDQNQRLQQRCTAINDLYKKEHNKYCRAIFMHLDSRSLTERIDVFFYHYENSVKGERLAKTLCSKFESKYKQYQPNRGFTGSVSERKLYVLKGTNPPCVFMELGNIQNTKDLERFNKVTNREAVAEWIAEGLAEDYKLEKKK